VHAVVRKTGKHPESSRLPRCIPSYVQCVALRDRPVQPVLKSVVTAEAIALTHNNIYLCVTADVQASAVTGDAVDPPRIRYVPSRKHESVLERPCHRQGYALDT
jgi:hypothetical protein